MISTPVGMRCPECARQRPQVRPVNVRSFGGGSEPATYVLIGLNVLVFLAEMLGGGSATDASGSLIRDAGLNAVAVNADGEWWRIITAGFLHAGLLHLAFNMFALYVLGTLLEPAVGTARFVAIYMVSLLAGSCGALVLDPLVNTVGASGAVFGLMSAAFIMARHRGLEQVASQIGLYVVINLVFTFSVSNISVGAHIGGLIGGAAAALVVAFFERRRVPNPLATEIAAMIVLGGIAIAGCLAAAAAGVPDFV
jgi:membrane associated rhomboid family serine protease